MTLGTNVPNDRLRRAIREAGCTYAELARDVRTVAAEAGGRAPRTNSSAVAHWVAGTRPAEQAARCLTEVLSRRLDRALLPEQLGLRTSGAADRAAGPDALARLTHDDLAGRTETVRAAYSVTTAALPLEGPGGSGNEPVAHAGSVRSARGAGGTGAGRTGAGRTGAGAGEIEAVRDMLELFTMADERHGGRHGRSAVVQYLHSDVTAFCRARFRTGEQHREMLGIASCLAHLAGWKAYDAGLPGLAQRYYLCAFEHAQAAADPAHEAFVLRVMAHHGMEAGRPEHTVPLMDAALERLGSGCAPATASLFVATRARALAVQGRRREAFAESSRALRLGQDADESELPYWAALWGPASACVHDQLAQAAAALGEPAVAEEHFARAARSSGGAGRPRITALSLAHTGAMQCRQGKVERACATWGRAMDLMDGVRSARVTAAVVQMRTELAPLRMRRSRTSLELDARARDWLLHAPHGRVRTT